MKFRLRNRKILAAVFSMIFFVMNILLSCHCAFACLETCSFQSEEDVNCSSVLAVRYQSFLHEGDIIVSGNETLIIEHEYHLIGNVTVKDNATLIIRNAILNQTGAASKIVVQDEAALEVIDSNITNSKSDVYIWVKDNSTVHIENSAISSFIESKLVIESYSKVNIKNSTLGRVVVWVCPEVFIGSSTITGALKTWGATTVRVLDSTIGFVWAGLGWGSVTMHIRGSTIGYVQSGSESEVWLIKTSLAAVWAGGNSKVWLIDTSEVAIHEFDNAAVFVGWDFPLFGPIAVHHTLVSRVRLTALIAVGATAFIVLFVIIRKLQKRRQVAFAPVATTTKC